MRQALAALIIGLLLLPGSLSAQTPAGPADGAAEDGRLPAANGAEEKKPDQLKTEEEEEEPGLIDVTHERISEAILASANWIDSFFGEERNVQEETETILRLGISNFTGRGNILDTDLRTSFRLDLPVLGEKLHLLFSGDDEDDEQLASPEGRTPRRLAGLPDQRASVSLRYFIFSTLRSNVSFSTGLRFRRGSPVFLIEPRYRQTFPLRDWELRFTQLLTASDDEKLEVRTRFDLERPLGDNFFFRNRAEGIWFHEVNGYFYNFHVILYQPLSSDRMLQYQWSSNFVTRPHNTLDETRFVLSYRQRIWREWLFIEASPQIAFPREVDYEISLGALLRLDIIFGDFPSFRISRI